MIGKYASHKKTKCEKCKGRAEKTLPLGQSVSINIKAPEEPRIDGEPNRSLHKLCCPYHQEPMKIIGVIKNHKWGDLITLQCQYDNCWLVVTISEQSKMHGPLLSSPDGTGFQLANSVDDIKRKLADGKLSSRWQEWMERVKQL
ncbi:hypothetical protein BpsS140_00046 [Bacillus phage vB_BpsS-140]|nr:hypothetical protein BpsS140_00046 [Bacillus phage vB_BpsS-140]